MKKLSAALLVLSSLNVYASPSFFNMAYVEVNDHHLSNAACYIRSDNSKPFINMVSIFAANVNGDDPNHPVIYFNRQVDAILNQSNQVSLLQQKGIKVLLTLLGNHQNAGWACMTDERGIQSFANEVVSTVNKYNLDGIDIDDEYSTCRSNNTSLIRITQAIKANPRFKGKIISKALFSDINDFSATYKGHKLAEFLDYGWEMSYGAGNFEYRLQPYLNYGMNKNKLSLGVNVNQDKDSGARTAAYLMEHQYPGLMIYNLGNNSYAYLTKLAQVEADTSIEVVPDCLR